METMMLQFKHKGPAPSVEDVRRIFKLEPEDIDREFGVIATDPAEGLYTALVATKAAQHIKTVLASRPRDPAEGLFANPRIEPFGPPQQ